MADNIVVKIVSDSSQLKETNKVLVESGAISKETEKRFTDLQNATTKVDGSFKSLRQQIKEAKTEAQALSQQFGENSRQATQAAQNVANLTEELSDFNNRVNALNPEEKFNALNRVIGGTIGAFQGLTGALQLFGGESEEVKKIAEKLQGFLNLTQGLNSVIGLKDAFKDLRVVLTGATASTTALSTATTGVAVAEGAATAGATAFGVAFTAATGGIILLIGGLVAAIYAVEKSLSDSSNQTERLQKKFADLEAARGTFDKTFLAKREEILDSYDFEIKKLEAVEASELKIIQAKVNRINAELAANRAAIQSGQSTKQLNEEIIKSNKKLIQDLELLKLKYETVKAKIQVTATIPKFKDIPPLEIKDVVLDPNIGKELQDAFDGLEPVKVEIETKKPKQKSFETDLKEIEDEEKAKAELTEQIAQQSFDLIAQLNANAFDRQLSDLDNLLAKKEISEEQYAKKVKEIKRKQAQDDKALALFQAAINIASAIIKVIDKPALIPFVASLGAVQLATIASRPIPKFKRGTLNVTGGNGGEDDVLAYLNRGEAVIPTDRNRDYNKTISAIFTRSVSAQDLNNFVVSKTSGSGKVTATINPYDLARGLKKSKREIETQARLTGQVIAKELSSSTNIRHVI